MSPRFLLRTFGGLTLSVGDGEPVLVNQRKRLALIATLTADANGGVARERLLALFWPESDAERARNALNQIVFAIRRDLGDEAIISDATSLRLDPAVVESDVSEFRRLIRAERYADAIDAYRGPFLDGVFLRDTPEFERWASDARDGLAADYARALEREIDAAANASPPRSSDVVRYARLLATHDPLSTQSALRIMRALERSGDTSAELKHAALHAAQVRAELDSEPGPALEREVGRLRALAAAPDDSRSSFGTTTTDATAAALSTTEAELVQEKIAPASDSTLIAPKSPRFGLRRLVIGVAAAAALVLVALSARRRADAVVISVEMERGDDAIGVARESILRSVSRLLESQQRFSIIVEDSVGQDVFGGCVARFYMARCRAEYVVVTRVARLGDTVSALTTVNVRGANGIARRDLTPLIRSRSELLALSADVAQAAAGAVAALADPRLPELAAGATLPRQDAYVQYAHAIDELLVDGPKAISSLVSAAAHDTAFAAPRTALLANDDSPARDSAAIWLEHHHASLSARDQLYVAVLEARNSGALWRWLELATQLRRLAPDDPFALREFADAAFANNFYQAADSASSRLLRGAGWPARMMGALWAQLDERHDAGDFVGALETMRVIVKRLDDGPFPCEMVVAQLAAMGREAAVESQIVHCVALRDNVGDLKRLGRRVGADDELYRRAGREYMWHGYAAAGQRAFDKAYAVERKLYSMDTTANNGWLAKELSRDWTAAYELMMSDFGWMYAKSPCVPADHRRACIQRNRLRFAVTAAHVGDTATANAALRWLDTPPHESSLYNVERAKILLALGRRDEAMRSLRDAAAGIAPGTWMHANTELLELRGDPGFEALIAPRTH